MIFPVLLVDATTRGTLPGRVARIDKRDRNAGTLRLVDDEVERIMALSDREMLEEAIRDGTDIELVVAEMTALFELALEKVRNGK